MSPQDKVVMVMLVLAALAIGIELFLPSDSRWRRPLLVFSIIVAVGAVLILVFTPGSIELVGV